MKNIWEETSHVYEITKKVDEMDYILELTPC